jgi:hypothetical protein
MMIAVLTICLTLSLTALGQQTSDVPVTCTINNYVDVVDPGSGNTQRIAMQVQSDVPSSYTNSRSLYSLIQGIGDWLLDTGLTIKNPTRKVFIDLSRPIAGSAPGGADPITTRPFVTALVHARFRTKLSQYGYHMLTMADEQMIEAPMTIGFYYPIGSSTHYRIHCTPGEQSSFPYSETDFVELTCTGTDGSQCNRWQVRPSGLKGGCASADCSVKSNRVKLVKVTTKGTRVTETDLGDFLMSFSIEITRP